MAFRIPSVLRGRSHPWLRSIPAAVMTLAVAAAPVADPGVQARAILAQVLEMDSENLVVLRLLTEDARSRQDWAGSVPLLEKLAVLDPEDKRWAEALKEARRFAEQVTPSDTGDSSFATMTLVDIYLAQGYRDKAVAALRQMTAREPGREDVRERLKAIVADSAGPQPARPGPAGAAAEAARAPDGSASRGRRQDEKTQFAEWINRIKQEGGPSS